MKNKISDSLKDKFLYKIDKITNPPCWMWTGAILNTGYGLAYTPEKNMYAHRLSFELFKNKIPKGMVINHKCHFKLCVNPDHLECVTQSQNLKDAHVFRIKDNKFRCGHSIVENNLESFALKRGYKICLTCRKNNIQKRVQEQKHHQSKNYPVILSWCSN